MSRGLSSALGLVLAASELVSAEPAGLVARPLVLGDAELEARLALEAGVSPRDDERATSFAPDVWLGITRRLTIGVVHSASGVGAVAIAATACVSGCDATYRNGALEVRHSIRDFVAARVRLDVRDLDPAKPGLALGAIARWQRGRFALTTSPQLRLGIAQRDRGNRASLLLPVWFVVQPVAHWAVGIHSGYFSDVAVWSDGYRVPIGLVVSTQATRCIELGFEAGLGSIFGPQVEVRNRVLVGSITWRRKPLSR
jgi:hypothetical protein